jgi:hypothetical protein
MTGPVVDYALLAKLQQSPHRSMTKIDPTKLPPGLDQVWLESLACHHLLDMIGVTAVSEREGESLDARVYRAVMHVTELAGRLGRIVERHRCCHLPGRLSAYRCHECGNDWPCPTARLADGTYTGGPQ